MPRSPSLTTYAKVLTLWAGIVGILFVGYGLAERTLLGDASPETLALLHLVRGVVTSLAVALAVAVMCIRSPRPLQEVVRASWEGIKSADEHEAQQRVTANLFLWLVRLRWIAIAGVMLTLLVAGYTLDRLPETPTNWLWTSAGLLLGYNAFLALAGPARSSWGGAFLTQILVDCLALAALVHFAGGAENPFLSLFVLHVVNAGIVLRARGALVVLGVAASLILVVVGGEAIGLLTHYCIQAVPAACTATTPNLMGVGIGGGLVLTLVGTSSFTRSLTARLRENQTQLLQANAALRRDKEEIAAVHAAVDRERHKLQAVVDCMEDAVIFSDPEGCVLLRNRRAFELWDMLCSGQGRLEQGHGSERWPALAKLFRAVSNDGTPHYNPAFECGGHSFEATYAPVRMEDGGALGLVMVARDVTERRAVERRLMTEERMTVVGKLAATVAHEINNPIGVIALYGQHALAKLPARSPVRDHLQTILRNAEACRRIVRDLLTLARSRESERRPVDLCTLGREIIQSLAPLAERSHVSVELHAEGDGSALLVQADPDVLRQAMLNIVLNAVEASPPGGTVALEVRQAAGHDGSAVFVEVKDEGVGIPAGDRERIFEPFYTTKASGTGLGLAVAKNIIEGHGGRIEVVSEPGHGTTFRIRLGLEAPAPAETAFARGMGA